FIQAIHATKPRGTMVVVSIFARPIEFNPMLLTNSGVKVTSTIAYSRQTFKQTVDLVTQHKIEVAPIITKEIALDDIVAEGFETLINDKKQAKILVELSGE
ncbi:MAG: butanediol dehydrogenase, partial [Limosilactobacillus sp.]